MDKETIEKNKTTQSSSSSGSSTTFSGTGVQAQLDYLKTEIEKYENKYENKTEKMREAFDQKIDDSKIRIIETLGIFVALFTFVSIDFQIFKYCKRDPMATGGLIMILLGSLMGFVLFLDYIIISRMIRSEGKFKSNNALILADIIILVLGVVLFSLSGK